VLFSCLQRTTLPSCCWLRDCQLRQRCEQQLKSDMGAIGAAELLTMDNPAELLLAARLSIASALAVATKQCGWTIEASKLTA